MDYVFYFDESFHDRKISIKSDGKMNILESNCSNCYVGVFWGCQSKDLRDLLVKIDAFENKQKLLYGLKEGKELKSGIVGQKYYCYGLQSFSKNALSFYSDFFDLLCDNRIILQLEGINKLEYFLRVCFRNVIFPDDINQNAFYYALTKFILTYKNPQLLFAFQKVINGESSIVLRDEIARQLYLIMDATSGITCKKQERIAFGQLLCVINRVDFNVTISEKTDFTYMPNFEGLCRLLDERDISIKRTKIVIDKEQNTAEAAGHFRFGKVKQADSQTTKQLHVSDILSGFVGRMIVALASDPRIKEDAISDIKKLQDNDLETKRLLSKEWFCLSEQHFLLYKKIYNALLVQQNFYWTAMTLSCGDDFAIFYSLIRYMAGYSDFQHFSEIDASQHSEYFNTACCEELQDKYSDF